MKKIISCLLTILLLVSVVSYRTPVTAAVGEPKFTVSSPEAHRGEHVSVTIKLKNNPGIASIKMKAAFDSALTLNSVTYNPALGGMSMQPQKLTSPVTLNWFNGVANTTGDMNYAVLDFTVAQDASIGKHAVTISYDPNDVYNIDEQNIPFKIVNGGVNVTVAVSGIAFEPNAATVSTGDLTYTLTPVISPSNATNKRVTWKSSDETVATVSGGVVSLLKYGETVITATTVDGGYEADFTLTVLCSHLKTEVVPAVPSTCIFHGHAEYTKCSDCGATVSGSDEPLPFSDHDYVDAPLPQYLKSRATCTSPAVYYKSCSVCGSRGTKTFKYGEPDPDNHVGGTHTENQKQPTCTEAGYTGDSVCNGCHVVLTYGSVIPATGHSYGEPVWTWSGFKSATASFSCDKGDDVKNVNATVRSSVTKQPTLTEEGERTYRATVSFGGKTYTDSKTEVIPKLYLIGDANGDLRVNIRDVTAIQRHRASIEILTGTALLAADTNGDGSVTIDDATHLQMYLAEYDVTLGQKS